jgi:hypothetical protein
VGNVKQNLAPRGELSAAHKRPPCDSMMERLMGSPIPVPLSLVVKNALKICSACDFDTLICDKTQLAELLR